jgi:hypothetical protein
LEGERINFFQGLPYMSRAVPKFGVKERDRRKWGEFSRAGEIDEWGKFCCPAAEVDEEERWRATQHCEDPRGG